MTPTPLKSRNLPSIVEPNPESDSDSFWEKCRLQATPIPGIVATLKSYQQFSGRRAVRPGRAGQVHLLLGVRLDRHAHQQVAARGQRKG